MENTTGRSIMNADNDYTRNGWKWPKPNEVSNQNMSNTHLIATKAPLATGAMGIPEKQHSLVNSSINNRYGLRYGRTFTISHICWLHAEKTILLAPYKLLRSSRHIFSFAYICIFRSPVQPFPITNFFFFVVFGKYFVATGNFNWITILYSLSKIFSVY